MYIRNIPIERSFFQIQLIPFKGIGYIAHRSIKIEDLKNIYMKKNCKQQLGCKQCCCLTSQ